MPESQEVSNLRNELEFRDKIIRKLELRILEKEEVIQSLESQVDKYQSILRQRGLLNLTEAHKKRNRGTGISAEPTSNKNNETTAETQLTTFPKEEASRSLIRQGILENDFLRALGPDRVEEIVNCMFLEEYNTGAIVIREGTPGSTLYVVGEGEVEVSRAGKFLSTMGQGKVFGELAILYNCERTATIKACGTTKLWCIKRSAFQAIMMREGIKRQTEFLDFLKSVPTFSTLSGSQLKKLADSIEERFFTPGEYIVRQGERGDTFYIIRNGYVVVTENCPVKDSNGNATEEKFIRSLSRGDFFGERALQGDDLRTANVRCEKETSCLTIDKELFNQLISSIDEVKTRYVVADNHRKELDAKYGSIELSDLRRITTLGVGGFGRVDLVTLKNDTKQSLALKKMVKSQIVATRQQDHIRSEKEIMSESDSPFIVQLYKTFKDPKYLYMLMEVCLGGELWTILRDKGQFDEPTTRFYSGCVLEAFNYLHKRNIIYRDLKPENMLLDAHGYVKLVDFGFAKKLDKNKTWTFCGTPEYVAPEIILNKGHDVLADYWSLGVLLFELLTGMPPFTGADPMGTYNVILRGIDAVGFPESLSKDAVNVIKRLCRDNANERLTYSTLIKHKWFHGFDWSALRSRSLTAPLIPQIASPTDASNFDLYPDEENQNAVAVDESGWDYFF